MVKKSKEKASKNTKLKVEDEDVLRTKAERIFKTLRAPMRMFSMDITAGKQSWEAYGITNIDIIDHKAVFHIKHIFGKYFLNSISLVKNEDVTSAARQKNVEEAMKHLKGRKGIISPQKPIEYNHIRKQAILALNKPREQWSNTLSNFLKTGKYEVVSSDKSTAAKIPTSLNDTAKHIARKINKKLVSFKLNKEKKNSYLFAHKAEELTLEFDDKGYGEWNIYAKLSAGGRIFEFTSKNVNLLIRTINNMRRNTEKASSNEIPEVKMIKDFLKKHKIKTTYRYTKRHGIHIWGLVDKEVVAIRLFEKPDKGDLERFNKDADTLLSFPRLFDRGHLRQTVGFKSGSSRNLINSILKGIKSNFYDRKEEKASGAYWAVFGYGPKFKKWQFQFGDFDKDAVEYELEEYRDGQDNDELSKVIMIKLKNADQKTIDAKAKELNTGAGNRMRSFKVKK